MDTQSKDEELRNTTKLVMRDHFRDTLGINLGQYKTEYMCGCGFKYITDGHDENEIGANERQEEHELDILMDIIKANGYSERLDEVDVLEDKVYRNSQFYKGSLQEMHINDRKAELKAAIEEIE